MSYLPEVYQEFRRRFPDVAKSYGDLADSCHHGGPLDEKTRRLVKLGVAMGVSSEGAVKSHARQALAGGVSADELRHAALMALTTAGFPTMVAAMKWIDEVVGKSE